MKEPKPLILVEHRAPRGTMELKLMGYIRHTVRNPEPFETASWYGISDMITIIQNQIRELSAQGRYRLSNTITVEPDKTYTSIQVIKTGIVTGEKDILLTISKPLKMKDIQQMRIKLVNLVPATFNNREHYSDAELRDLTASIKQHGIQASLNVRPHPTLPGKYEIIGGFRRHKAGTAAGVEDAPCNVKEMTDDEAYQLMLIDNLHREDIHPLDEGNSFKKLAEKHTAEEIAGMIHKSKSYVLKRMKLADLILAAQKMFYEDKMTYVQAIQIARLTVPDQEKLLKNCIRSRYMDGGREEKYLAPEQEIRNWIQDNVALDLKNAPFDLADATLLIKAGSCDVCPKRTRNQGDLFDNATKNDRCMDPGCFGMKKQAHIALQVNKLEQKFETVLVGEKAAYNNSIKIGDKQVPIIKKGAVEGAIPVVVKAIQYGGVDAQKTLGQTVYVAPDYKNPAKSPSQNKQNAKDKREQELRKAVYEKCVAFREQLFFKIFDKLTKVMPSGKVTEATLPDWAFQELFDAMCDYGSIGDDDNKGILAYAFKLAGMGPETEVKDWNTQFDDIKDGEKKLQVLMRKLPVSNLVMISLSASEATNTGDVTKITGIHQIATHLRLDPDGLKKAFSKSYDNDLRAKQLKAEGEKKLKELAKKKPKGKGLAALLPDAKKVNGTKSAKAKK